MACNSLQTVFPDSCHIPRHFQLFQTTVPPVLSPQCGHIYLAYRQTTAAGEIQCSYDEWCGAEQMCRVGCSTIILWNKLSFSVFITFASSNLPSSHTHTNTLPFLRLAVFLLFNCCSGVTPNWARLPKHNQPTLQRWAKCVCWPRQCCALVSHSVYTNWDGLVDKMHFRFPLWTWPTGVGL